MNPVDIIGDVHGCAGKLSGLLRMLGYDDRHGTFRHPERTAVFVGDLIDRGPQQVEVLSIVRSMVDAGSAEVLMGNHEFNAVAYVTPSHVEPGGFLRSHSPKNRHQHEAFLGQVGENSALHNECIEWFKTLPLWLDLGAIRIVHACWHETSLAALAPLIEPEGPLSEEFFVEASTRDSPVHEAVETILKGPEIELGSHGPYLDKEGVVRSAARIRWWDPEATTLRTLAEIPKGATKPDGSPLPTLPDRADDVAVDFRYDSDVPVFFGHYWFVGTLDVTGPHSACLDYSAFAGGPLVAYRWDGESELTNDHLVGFGRG